MLSPQEPPVRTGLSPRVPLPWLAAGTCGVPGPRTWRGSLSWAAGGRSGRHRKAGAARLTVLFQEPPAFRLVAALQQGSPGVRAQWQLQGGDILLRQSIHPLSCATAGPSLAEFPKELPSLRRPRTGDSLAYSVCRSYVPGCSLESVPKSVLPALTGLPPGTCCLEARAGPQNLSAAVFPGVL